MLAIYRRFRKNDIPALFPAGASQVEEDSLVGQLHHYQDSYQGMPSGMPKKPLVNLGFSRCDNTSEHVSRRVHDIAEAKP